MATEWEDVPESLLPKPDSQEWEDVPKSQLPDFKQIQPTAKTRSAIKGAEVGGALGGALGGGAGRLLGAGVGALVGIEEEQPKLSKRVKRAEPVFKAARVGKAVLGEPGEAIGGAIGALSSLELPDQKDIDKASEDFLGPPHYVPNQAELGHINRNRQAQGLPPIQAEDHPLTSMYELKGFRGATQEEKDLPSKAEIEHVNGLLAKEGKPPLDVNNEPPALIESTVRAYRRLERKVSPKDRPTPTIQEGGVAELPVEGAKRTQLAGTPAGYIDPTSPRMESRWPTPSNIASRLVGTAGGLAHGLLGDTELTRDIEESWTGLLPTKEELHKLGIHIPGSKLLSIKEGTYIPDIVPSREEALAQIDEMREKQGRPGLTAHQKWRRETGGIVSAEHPEPKAELPNIIDLKGSTLDNIVSDPNGPFGDFQKVVANFSFMSPSETNPLYKRLTSGPILPERQQKAMLEMDKERQKNRARNIGNFAGNAARDLSDLILSVVELGNNLIGVTKVPHGVSETVSSHEFGYNLGLMPGQLGSLLIGLGDLNGKNSMLTNPFLVTQALIQPAIAFASKIGLGVPALAVKNNVIKFAKPIVDHVVDRLPDPIVRGVVATADATRQAKAKLSRWFVDGLAQGNPKVTALLERLLYGPENIREEGRALIENMAKQIEEGNVELETKETQPVEIRATPEPNITEEQRAQRTAAKAEQEAARYEGKAEAARQAAKRAKDLRRAVKALQGKAESVKLRVARAATEYDRVQLRKRLADLENGRRVLERRLEVEAQESRMRAESEKAVEDMAMAGVPLAEQAKGVQQPSYARQEKAAVSAAEDIPEYTLEEWGTEEEQQVALNSWQQTIDTLNKQLRQAKGVDSREALKSALQEAVKQHGQLKELLELERDQNARPATSKEYLDAARIANERAKELFNAAKPAEKIRDLKLAAKQADAALMRSWKASERFTHEAEAIRQKGLSSEEALRSRGEQVQRALDERAKKVAGRAATAGVELGEQAARVDAETAADMAQEVASQQAPEALRARKKAERLREEAETAGVRPEVTVGKVYLPVEKANQLPRAMVEGQYANGKLNQLFIMDKRSRAYRDALEKIYQNKKLFNEMLEGRDYVYNRLRNRPENIHLAESEFHEKYQDLYQAYHDLDMISQDPRAFHEWFGEGGEYPKAREEFQKKAGAVQEFQTKALDLYEKIKKAKNEQEARSAESDLRAHMGMPEDQPIRYEQLEADLRKHQEQRVAAPGRQEPGYGMVPKHQRLMLQDLTRDTSVKKQAALDSGFNPNDPASAETLRQTGLPAGSTIYDAGIKYAEHLNAMDVSDIPGHISDWLEQQGVQKGTVAAGDWLYDNAKLNLAHRYVIEPKFGAAPRPAPVTTRFRATEQGHVIERPQSAEIQYQRERDMSRQEIDDMANDIVNKSDIPSGPLPKDTPLVAGRLRQLANLSGEDLPNQLANKLVDAFTAQQEAEPKTARAREARLLGERMMDRRIGDEPPQPFRAKGTGTRPANPVYTYAAEKFAEQAHKTPYEPSVTPEDVAKGAPATEDITAPKDKFDADARAVQKKITPERVMLRLAEALLDESTQKLRSRDFQTACLKQFVENAEKAGYKGEALERLVGEFNKQLTDTKRLSSHGKNQFFEFEAPNGKVIWSTEDIVNVTKKMDPELLRKIQARVFREVGEAHADAMHLYGVVQNLNTEINRFRMDSSGKVIDSTLQNVAGYANELGRRVVREGETQPLMMPYSGSEVSKMLRKMAEEPGVSASERHNLQILSDRLERRMVNADTYAKGELANIIKRNWSRVFGDTEPLPDLHNMYIDRGVADSIMAHLQMLSDSSELSPAFRLFYEMSKYAKRSVVALNARALINNDFSNALLQSFRRTDPMQLINTVLEPMKFNDYLEGNFKNLSPQEVRMYRAINEAGIVNKSRITKDLGQTKIFKELKGVAGELGETLSRKEAFARSKGFNISKLGAEQYSKLQEYLADAYSNLGDIPFRIEEAVNVIKNTEKKVGMLKDGEYVVINVTPSNKVMLTMENGRIRVTDVSGKAVRPLVGSPVPEATSQAKGPLLNLESPELARLYAENAKVVQDRVLLNPNRLGNAGKWLSSKGLSPFSGIFSWYFGAMDIFGLKSGLVTEMLKGNPVLETNSGAVQALQRSDRLALAGRRATMVSMAASAFKDQRKLRELRKAAAWNPAVEGVILAEASNPAYASVRSDEPLLFTQPTAGVLNAIEALSSKLEFGPVTSDPQLVFNTMAVDAAKWDKLTDAEWGELKRSNPKMYDYGREMQALIKDDPDEYDKLLKRKSDFIRWASGEQVSPEQLLQMVGLSGGPLIRWMRDVGDSTKRNRQLTQDFGKIFFGATPWGLLDVASGALGEAGYKDAAEFSTYGKDMQRQGFAGAGGMEYGDESTLGQWAIRQLLGIGWANAAMGDADDPESGEKVASRLNSYLTKFQQKLTSSIVDSAKDAAKKPLPANPTKEDIDNKRRLMQDADMLIQLVADTVDQQRAILNEQLDALNKSRKDHPAPTQKP